MKNHLKILMNYNENIFMDYLHIITLTLYSKSDINNKAVINFFLYSDINDILYKFCSKFIAFTLKENLPRYNSPNSLTIDFFINKLIFSSERFPKVEWFNLSCNKSLKLKESIFY